MKNNTSITGIHLEPWGRPWRAPPEPGGFIPIRAQIPPWVLQLILPLSKFILCRPNSCPSATERYWAHSVAGRGFIRQTTIKRLHFPNNCWSLALPSILRKYKLCRQRQRCHSSRDGSGDPSPGTSFDLSLFEISSWGNCSLRTQHARLLLPCSAAAEPAAGTL